MFELCPLFDTLENLTEVNPFINKQIRLAETSGVKSPGYEYELALDFLEDNSTSPQTFKSYRSELEKFLMWCWYIQGISIADLDKRLMREYINYIKNPDSFLIGTPTNSRFRLNKGTGLREPNEKWRPFVKVLPKATTAKTGLSSSDAHYSLSEQSIKVCLTALSSFYSHLNDVDYCEKNPPAVLKRKREFKVSKQNLNEDMKYFNERQWFYIFNAAIELSEIEPDKHARTRFLIALLYGLYPRLSELATRPGYSPMMSDFYVDQNTGAFLFKVPISKGYKGRNIAVSDELKSELIRYREHLGLSPLPYKNEKVALFCRHTKAAGGIKTLPENLEVRQLRQIAQVVFDKAHDNLILDGFENDADVMLSASPHWLRHTGISHDININKRDLSYVRDDAGHESIETTSLYLHTSSVERYKSAKSKSLLR